MQILVYQNLPPPLGEQNQAFGEENQTGKKGREEVITSFFF